MQTGKERKPIVYSPVALLGGGGEPLVDLPLSERRKRLLKLLDRRNRTVQFSESFDDGPALLAAAKERRLEGVMGKRLQARHPPGEGSRGLLQIKGHAAQEVRGAGA